MSKGKNLILYRHNEEAYTVLNILINKFGKACIIHPTGTGKSVIAFRYIMDNPGKSVLWLSPSNNIFELQKDSLWWMLDEEVYYDITDRITFYTYSKLYRLITARAKVNADIIILDEFHRCGANTWYKAVQSLLRSNCRAIVIGLSADSIRYFDNKRDMASELFDDNVASRITLMEAINKKILPCPKYVISECINDIGKISDMRKKYINTTVTVKGLDRMFEKHMKKRGRYIIFCSRYHQLDYVRENIGAWVSGIDKNPAVYVIKAGGKGTLRTLRKFKDDDSKHLKLLLCVNILNEGIHIYGLDGVVFFRHTISPTLYLQQLGRALLTGSDKQPVIFDIVGNYTNLCTFDSSYDRPVMSSHSSPIFIYDEAASLQMETRFKQLSSRSVINKVHKSLTGKWEAYYMEAKKYYSINGDLDIPITYTTDKGASLGKWLRTQKRIRAGLIKGNLSVERQHLLESIGIEWYEDSYAELVTRSSFVFDNYDLALKYLKEYGNRYGHMCIKSNYMTDGFRLGKWVWAARLSRYSQARTFSPEQLKELDSIGFPWDYYDSLWEGYYRYARHYYDENGHIRFPRETVIEGLGKIMYWIYRQRTLARRGMLPPDKAERFRAIDPDLYKTNVKKYCIPKTNKVQVRKAALFNLHKDVSYPGHYDVVASYDNMTKLLKNADDYDTVLTGDLTSLARSIPVALERLERIEKHGLRVYFTELAINNRDTRLKYLVTALRKIINSGEDMEEMLRHHKATSNRRGSYIIVKTLEAFSRVNAVTIRDY